MDKDKALAFVDDIRSRLEDEDEFNEVKLEEVRDCVLVKMADYRYNDIDIKLFLDELFRRVWSASLVTLTVNGSVRSDVPLIKGLSTMKMLNTLLPSEAIVHLVFTAVCFQWLRKKESIHSDQIVRACLIVAQVLMALEHPDSLSRVRALFQARAYAAHLYRAPGDVIDKKQIEALHSAIENLYYYHLYCYYTQRDLNLEACWAIEHIATEYREYYEAARLEVRKLPKEIVTLFKSPEYLPFIEHKKLLPIGLEQTDLYLIKLPDFKETNLFKFS